MVAPLPLGTRSKVLNFSTTLFLGLALKDSALVEKRLEQMCLFGSEKS